VVTFPAECTASVETEVSLQRKIDHARDLLHEMAADQVREALHEDRH